MSSVRAIVRGTICGLLLSTLFAAKLVADDGYRLWLRYDPIQDGASRAADIAACGEIVLATPGNADTPVLQAAREEITVGLKGMLGLSAAVTLECTADHLKDAGEEGYTLQSTMRQGHGAVRIAANSDLGVLYGVFAFLRNLQTRQPVDHLNLASAPKIQRRMLNHWDNLNGSIEHGYAGHSIWEWKNLPDILSPRYRNYARACASIGINGSVLNNVNSDALLLTPAYLCKVAALADVFRPYGVRVYLTTRFSAPMEIGGLKTADPLDPEVIAWWKAKADEIYQFIPDFGGILMKANSEHQPGPQSYGRSHADGANVLARALAPHGGIVLWRTFVYEGTADRIGQAYTEFKPLDGKFDADALLQVKNGPLDFQPREPFSPLFGAMPHTSLSLEVQISQEYLGGSIDLAYLAPLWKEVMESDTLAEGPGSTVARVVDGSLDHHTPTVMAGVANIGSDRNWCGHPLAASNWYAFGRLAWDSNLAADAIADEWTRQTFSSDPQTVQTIRGMLLASREIVVDYTGALGLHHVISRDHHDPAPWERSGFHQADQRGLGFDRTATGTNTVAQYAPALAARLANVQTCPENLLLWFHHVPWDFKMHSGRSLWDELCCRYQEGVDRSHELEKQWDSLADKVDPERFDDVKARLAAQEAHARRWKDASILYFQTFSKLPFPTGVEPPEHPLEYYKALPEGPTSLKR